MSGNRSWRGDPAWLPGFEAGDGPESRLEGQTVAGASFSVPRLDEEGAAAVAEHVRSATLRARDSHRFEDVVRAVGAAAGRLADPGDSFGRAAIDALGRASGFSASAARTLLREHAAGWTPRVLTDLVATELGDVGYLDAVLLDPTRPGRRRRAAGPALVHLVLAGNVPGVAVTAVIRSLLVRSGVLCKLPASEPWLPGLFARALSEEDPALGSTLATTWWPGDAASCAAADAWTKRSGKVIIYGGADAVRALRARTPPSTPLVEYGPRVGVVVLGRAARTAELEGLARDTFAYDQAGCVSPRLVYLLSNEAEADADATGTATRRRLDRLASALSSQAKAEEVAPPGDAEAIAIRAARSALQFEPGKGEVRGPDDLAWTILYRSRAGTYSEPLPRVLWVYRLEGIEELGRLRGVLEGRIQAMGLAGLEPAAERRAEQLAVELGVSRVTRPGDMAWPPPDWRHDGRLQLLPLVRWTDFETTGPIPRDDHHERRDREDRRREDETLPTRNR